MEVDEESGFIINLADLNSIVKTEVIDIMDHSQIEIDIPWFRTNQPSTENMVIFIWNQITSKFLCLPNYFLSSLEKLQQFLQSILDQLKMRY